MKRIILATLISSLSFATSMARADICSTNPNERSMIRVTEHPGDLVQFEKCDVQDGKNCELIGTGLISKRELRKMGREHYGDAVALALSEVVIGGVVAASVVAGVAGALAEEEGTALIAGMSGIFSIGGWGFFLVEKKKLGTLNPIKLIRQGRTFRMLAKPDSKGCIYSKNFNELSEQISEQLAM